MEFDYRRARDWVFGIQREGGRVTAYLPSSANIRERALLLALVEFAPNMEPSTVALAKMLGLGTVDKPDEKAVRRLLRSCEAKGFLTVEHRAGQRSRYTINPGHCAPPQVADGEAEPRAPRPPTQGNMPGVPRAPRPPKQTNKADKKADKDPEPLRLELVRSKSDRQEPPSAHKQVTDHYFACFKAEHGRDPIFGSREGNDVKRLLVKLNGDHAEACRRIGVAFRSFRKKTVTISDIGNKPDAFASDDVGAGRRTEVQRGAASDPGAYGIEAGRALVAGAD